MHCNAPGGQIFYFQNTFDSDGDKIRMEIQTENFFGNLILTRLKDWPEHMYRDLFLFYNLVKITLPKTSSCSDLKPIIVTSPIKDILKI
jgi:hypothetical protein